MRDTVKVLNLASALAALAAPPAIPPIANAAESDTEGIAVAITSTEEIAASGKAAQIRDTDLMSFTVHRSSNGMLFPQHGSHSSHASHVSHASSSPGYGGSDTANLPNLPYVPPAYPPSVYPPSIYPPSVYPPSVLPPPVAVPPGPPASPTPGGTTNIAAVACSRASNGLGVNEIAIELESTYGITASEAASIAKQALTSVLAGGHFCDGSYGGHGLPEQRSGQSEENE